MRDFDFLIPLDYMCVCVCVHDCECSGGGVWRADVGLNKKGRAEIY